MLSALATEHCQTALHLAVDMVAVAMVVAIAVAAVVRAAAVAIMTGVAVPRQAQTISQVCTRPVADLCLIGCNVLLEPACWLFFVSVDNGPASDAAVLSGVCVCSTLYSSCGYKDGLSVTQNTPGYCATELRHTEALFGC